MILIVHPAYGGWRWMLRHDVTVLARGQVLLGEDGKQQAVADAEEFRKAVSTAAIEIKEW